MESGVLKKIFNGFLCRKLDQVTDYGLFNGLSGELLFLLLYKYYVKDCSDSLIEQYYNKINSILDNSSALYVNWGNGVCGYFYVFNYLLNNKMISTDMYEYDSSFDYIVYNKILEFIEEENFDCLYGAGGMLYFLQSRINYNNEVSECLIDIIDQIYMKRNIFFDPERKFDLGIPHGISGLMLVFCKISDRLNRCKKTLDILERISLILLYYFKNGGSDSSFFPKYDTDGSYEEIRSAWCYGDLSCGLALLECSRFVNINKSDILEMLNSLSTKRNMMNNDIGVCHGIVGLMYIFRYLYDTTRIENFRNSSIYWKLKFMEKLKYLDNIDFSLINGKAGVGLSLLNEKYGNMTILRDVLFL